MSRLSQSQLKRLSVAYCQGCRRPYRNGERSLVGKLVGTPSKRLVRVGECCTDRLSSIVAIAVYHPPEITAWDAADTAWFAANRDRSHRVRPAFPDELPRLARRACF